MSPFALPLKPLDLVAEQLSLALRCCRALTIHVVERDEAPTEHQPTLDYRLGCLFEEDKLLRRILLLFMQSLNGLFDLFQLLVQANVTALAMLPIPIIVHLESLHLSDCCLLRLNLLSERFIVLFLIIK